MSDYTPPIEDVRNHYAYGCGPEHTWDESRAAFDRWLASVKSDALEDWAEYQDNILVTLDYMATAEDHAEVRRWTQSARSYAEKIEKEAGLR